MGKLELALLVGAESKEWLASLDKIVTRLEKLQPKLASAKSLEEAEDDFDNDEGEEDDEDFTPKKQAAKKNTFEDEDEEEESSEEEETEEASDDEDEEEDAPPKKKAKKLTVDDVNDACKKKAAKIGGKEGRNEVLKILKKKFKTTSVSELKPEQYAAAIAAMGA